MVENAAILHEYGGNIDADLALVGGAEEEPQPLPRLTPEEAQLVANHAFLPQRIVAEAIKKLPIRHLRDDAVGYLEVALCECVTKYDPDRGVEFQTYATKRLRYAVIDFVREISVLDFRPRSSVKKYIDAQRAAEENPGEASDTQTPHLITLVSLDERRHIESGNSLTLEDQIADPNPTPEDEAEYSDHVSYIWNAIDALPPDLSEIVKEHLAGKTLEEIGFDQEYTESRACQKLAKARQLLHEALDIDEPAYSESALANHIIQLLGARPQKRMTALASGDVVKRMVTQTGQAPERITGALHKLLKEGRLGIEYTTEGLKTSTRVASINLIERRVVPAQRKPRIAPSNTPAPTSAEEVLESLTQIFSEE